MHARACASGVQVELLDALVEVSEQCRAPEELPHALGAAQPLLLRDRLGEARAPQPVVNWRPAVSI